MGYVSSDLESRFSAVLSKAAEVAYCPIDVFFSPSGILKGDSNASIRVW